MDIKISIISYWMIWQCCTWHLYSKECNSSTLDYYPANLSLKTSGSHTVLSWDCPVPEDIQNLIYEIHIKTFEGIWHYVTEFSVRQETNCSKEISLEKLKTIPPVICLNVIPALHSNECEDLSSEICADYGRNGTLAENISCSVYNTSMICNWTFGTYVQQNAMYKVSLIQETPIQHYCQQYEYDWKKRTGSCTLRDLKLDFFIDVTIIFEVYGSVRQEYRFKPAEQEIFNPPRNINILCSLEDIEIHWIRPHTHYNVNDGCFEYVIEMNKVHYKTSNNTYTIPIMGNKCLVRIRARGTNVCQMNTNWGQWSEMKVCEQDRDERLLDAALISVIVVSGLITVFLIITTTQYKRVYNVCFPTIPKPKNYFDCTQDGKINVEKNIYVAAGLPTFEIEEYITLSENI